MTRRKPPERHTFVVDRHGDGSMVLVDHVGPAIAPGVFRPGPVTIEREREGLRQLGLGILASGEVVRLDDPRLRP